ncbi:MAG: acyltransferase [Pseudomonadota bacterium]
MLEGLQAGRAVAAIAVAVFHANVFLLPQNFYDGEGAGAVFNFGYAGVEFFFVLSGFIMVLVHRGDFGKSERVGLFLSKRFLRIYPIYWVIMIVLTALYFAMPSRGPEHARDLSEILASFLLVPTVEGPIMAVAWTLQHEMLFYLVFAVLIWRPRIGIGLFGAWMIGCLAALPFYGTLPYPLDFLLKSHNLLFALGIGTAWIYTRFSQQASRGLFWIGLAVFLATGLGETVAQAPLPRAVLPLMYGVGSAFMLIGLTRGDFAVPRWLSFLGDASYSIYLVHLPAMNFCAVIIKAGGLHEFLPPFAMLVLIAVIATLVGCIVHVLIEKPLIYGARKTILA